MDELHAQNSSANNSGNYFLIGFMGSGKSHWGKLWASANQMQFADIDEIIERTTGKPIADIFEQKGEVYFRKLEAAALRSCETMKNTIIACGGGTPCYHDNMLWMNEQGLTVYITCTSEEVMQRVSFEIDKRPLFKKINPAELVFFIEQKVKEREPFYKQAKVTVHSHQLNIDSFAQEILASQTLK